MLSIVYIMINNHSLKCIYTATLRHFISKILGGGGGAVMPLEAKKLSPHYMPVKVLGHTDLPFFIPEGLTALHKNITFEYHHSGQTHSY